MLTLSYPGAALASECGRATRAIVRCAHPRITSPLLARRLGARSAAAAQPDGRARDALVDTLEDVADADAVGLAGRGAGRHALPAGPRSVGTCHA